MRFLGIMLFIFFISGIDANSQKGDSAVHLRDVSVEAYLEKDTLIKLPAAVSIINNARLGLYRNDPLPAMNSVAGVRMEERSPGSYRLAIRGSLLRSPFGVRNVKIYIDDFPLTDATGNTYLNLMDFSQLQSIEILKGPDGSLFGANSGGVVILKPRTATNSYLFSAGISSGSYGYFNQQVELTDRTERSGFNISQSYQRFDGYRDNSMMDRFRVQVSGDHHYTATGKVRLFFAYTNLYYQTPGGLNAAQFAEDPRQARPATTFLPGAAEQRAAVYNTNYFGGISNELRFGRFRWVLALFGQHTNFSNPFITNYEIRRESSYGLRTYISGDLKRTKNFGLKCFLGGEWQNTHSWIRNFSNIGGTPGLLQASDRLTNTNYFIFARANMDLFRKLRIEVGLSVNANNFEGNIDSLERKNFAPQVLPKFGMSYSPVKTVAIRATISRGYSPPTLAEFRPSDNNFYPELDAEHGWNYEGGLRLMMDHLRLDLTGYYFRLEQAIVRKINADGTESFVNAGIVNYAGIESEFTVYPVPRRSKGIMRECSIHNSSTVNFFRFENYTVLSQDHSGNKVTGVPDYVLVTDISLLFKGNIHLYVEHTFTGRLPLDDANSAFAEPFHILRAKITWRYTTRKNLVLELYAGGDNLLNQVYSLGNDLNAVGGRYYNAAPGISGYGGLKLHF